MRALSVVSLIPTAPVPILVDPITRYRMPGSDSPVAQAVEISGGVTMVHLSGVVPPIAPLDPGDTRSQTEAVLRSIEATLRRLDLGMADVVRMQAFLVGDPALGGRMDYDGFMTAYSQFFGTPGQPGLPVRSVVQVAALADPDWLVEIEVSAARPRR